jgi:N-acetylmuramoyl-L-alanine amidase
MILSSLLILIFSTLPQTLTIIKIPRAEPIILNQIKCNNEAYFELEELIESFNKEMVIEKGEKFLKITLNNRSAYLFENSPKIVTDRTYSMEKPFISMETENCIPYDGVLILLKFFFSGEPEILTIEEPENPEFGGVLNLPSVKEHDKITIILDAGHGGEDSGTKNESGLLEKDITLDVSLILGEILEDNGFTVVYTRNDDVTLPLPHRVAIANSSEGDLLVSIHVNNSKNKNANGLEVFFLNSTSSDEEANELAIRENAEYKVEAGDPVVSNIIKDLGHTRLLLLGRELAEHIYLSAKNLLTTDRGVKQAPFYILSGAKMPGVLVEIGFLSNEQEATLLEEPEYRERIAEAIFEGIKRFVKEKGGSLYAEKGK